MADNRMSLKHGPTRAEFILARFMWADGWHTFPSTDAEKVAWVDRLEAWLASHHKQDLVDVGETYGLVYEITDAPTRADLRARVAALEAELDKALAWVSDLQSGMWINCVYCGHRYGPRESPPATMADVLKAHVVECPKHPMSILARAMASIRDFEPTQSSSRDPYEQIAYHARMTARIGLDALAAAAQSSKNPANRPGASSV